jgi:DnaJ family protein C protein 19
VARQALFAFHAWRAAPRAALRFYEGGFEPEMSREEALKILDLRQRDLSKKPQLLEKSRNLVMKGAHTDHGGSHYLASKVNAVRMRRKRQHS